MSKTTSPEEMLLGVLRTADEPTDADRERVKMRVLERVAAAGGLAALAASQTAIKGAVLGAPAQAATSAGSAEAASIGLGGAQTGVSAGTGAASSSAIASAGVAASGTVAATGAAVGSSGLAGAVGTAAPAVVAAKGILAAKLSAVAVALGMAGGGSWYWIAGSEGGKDATPPHSSSRVAPESHQAAPVLVPPLPRAPARSSEESAPEEAVPAENPSPAVRPLPAFKRAPPASSSATASEPSRTDRLAQEAELLKQAQQAINGGATDEALRILERHATEFPRGVLAQERRGVRAIALCRAGNRQQGAAEAERFLARNRSSPLAERVRTSCELD